MIVSSTLWRKSTGSPFSCASAEKGFPDSNLNHRCRSSRRTKCNRRKSRCQNRSASTNLTVRYCRTQQYSITALTDSSGVIKERYAYDAYGGLSIFDGSGTARTSTAEGNRYTYTGREWDEEFGLYHYRARMYDSITGRFCSRDPIGYADSASLYRQHLGLSGVDPLGLEWTMPAGSAIGSDFPWMWGYTPENYPHAYAHKEGNKRCKFVFDPSVTIPGMGGIPGQTILITGPGQMADHIRKHKCCEIFIIGHNYASGGGNPDNVAPGGSHIGDDLIFPTTQGHPYEEESIRDALKEIGCNGCSLFMYACGGCGGDSTLEDLREEQRQLIADRTGCHTYGTRVNIITGIKGNKTKKCLHTTKCDNWFCPVPLATTIFQPIPFIHYPPGQQPVGLGETPLAPNDRIRHLR